MCVRVGDCVKCVDLTSLSGIRCLTLQSSLSNYDRTARHARSVRSSNDISRIRRLVQ